MQVAEFPVPTVVKDLVQLIVQVGRLKVVRVDLIEKAKTYKAFYNIFCNDNRK